MRHLIQHLCHPIPSCDIVSVTLNEVHAIIHLLLGD